MMQFSGENEHRKSRGRVLGIATTLRAGWTEVRIPLRKRVFFYSPKLRDFSRAHVVSYLLSTGIISPG